jgi:hypothetical protein
MCRAWHELAAGAEPLLGAFLAGWYWRDMGNQLPGAEQIGQFTDSFRVGWREADTHIAIKDQQNARPIGKHAPYDPLR